MLLSQAAAFGAGLLVMGALWPLPPKRLDVRWRNTDGPE
jgi:hypothetical protein